MTRTGRSGFWRGIRCGAVCCTVLSLVGCIKRDGLPPPPTPVVEVTTPQTRAVTEYFQYTGTLESVATVEIRARVSGFLEEVRFAESSDVSAGDILFTIEKEPYELAVGQAQAEVARAESMRDLAEARLERGRQAQQVNAASDLEVIELEAEVQRTQADLLAAQERLKAAELDLSYTDVRTPIDGRVDRNYVDTGNLVGRTEATLLARVVQLDPVRVNFDVSENISLRYLSRGRDGRVDDEAPPVEVGLSDEEGEYPHLGRVDFVDNVLNAQTGTLGVRAVLPNPTRKLYPGLFARIRVPWETREDAIVIEEEAISTGLDGKFVLVVGDGNIVDRRLVTLGERQDDGMVAVLDGLDGSETYIVRGVQKARPGAEVDPRPYEASSSTTPSPSTDDQPGNGAEAGLGS
ncbi:MAG: efflux RND transporter periplasmic adaptor subunit [Planctomycetota bacterium]